MPHIPDTAESLAECVVPLVIPGSNLVRRDHGGHRIRDFDVLYPDGHSDPLEVTRATLAELLAAQSAHFKHMGFRRDLTGLKGGWHIMPNLHASFRTWTDADLTRFLAALEADGIHQFFFARHYANPTLRSAARELGISAALASQTTVGKVLVSLPGDQRGWQSNEADPGAHAVEVLEELSLSRDNIEKLSVGSASERHLFVAVDIENNLPWKDLQHGHLPNRPPRMGHPITTGWLVTTFAKSVLCWVYSPTQGWTSTVLDRAAVYGEESDATSADDQQPSEPPA